MYYCFNKRITSWFNPTSFHSHSQWRADYVSSQIMVIFHVYILIKIWGIPHILIKYKFVTSHKYEVNLILLSRHCLVNDIRLIFYKHKVVSLFCIIAGGTTEPQFLWCYTSMIKEKISVLSTAYCSHLTACYIVMGLAYTYIFFQWILSKTLLCY